MNYFTFSDVNNKIDGIAIYKNRFNTKFGSKGPSIVANLIKDIDPSAITNGDVIKIK